MEFLKLQNQVIKSQKYDDVTYLLLKLIGNGAEGCVYKCQKRQNNQNICQMAIKFQKQISEREQQFIGQLIEQPNKFIHLIGFYEIFEYNNAICTVQELADGDLYSYINESKNLTSKEKISIFLQMALGVKELHDNKLIHRDLKPENVLKIKQSFKICDFGIIRTAAAGGKQTIGVGTPYYQAPEILNEKGVYSEKVDIWSLAHVFYEVCSGCPLIDGNSVGEITQKIRNYDKVENDEKIKILLETILDKEQQSLIKLLIDMTSIKDTERPSIDEVITKIQIIQPKPIIIKIINPVGGRVPPPHPIEFQHKNPQQSSGTIFQTTTPQLANPTNPKQSSGTIFQTTTPQLANPREFQNTQSANPPIFQTTNPQSPNLLVPQNKNSQQSNPTIFQTNNPQHSKEQIIGPLINQNQHSQQINPMTPQQSVSIYATQTLQPATFQIKKKDDQKQPQTPQPKAQIPDQTGFQVESVINNPINKEKSYKIFKIIDKDYFECVQKISQSNRIMKFDRSIRRSAKQFIYQIMETSNQKDRQHIIQVEDHFNYQDGTITVYEWYQQTSSLNIQIKENKLQKNPLDLCLQLCEALKYFHSNNYVHGDIKSESIFFVEKQWKFGDFSHVKQLPSLDNQYLAPEQKKKVEKKYKSDIFSLGKIFQEINYKNNEFYNQLKTLIYQMIDADPSKRLCLDEILRMIDQIKKKQPILQNPALSTILENSKDSNFSSQAIQEPQSVQNSQKIEEHTEVPPHTLQNQQTICVEYKEIETQTSQPINVGYQDNKQDKNIETTDYDKVDVPIKQENQERKGDNRQQSNSLQLNEHNSVHNNEEVIRDTANYKNQELSQPSIKINYQNQDQPEKGELNKDKQTDQDQKKFVDAQQQNAQNQDLNEKGELNLDNNTNKQDQNILDNQKQNPQKQPEKEKLNQDKQTDQDQEIVNTQQQNAQNQDLNEKGELNLDNNTNKIDQNILHNQQQNPQKQPEKEKLNQDKQTDQDQEIVNAQQQNAQNQDLNEKGELNLDNNTNKQDQNILDNQQQNPQKQPEKEKLNQEKQTDQDQEIVNTQQQNAQNQDLNEKGELNLDNNTNKQDQNILDNQKQNPQKQPEKEKLNQDKQTDQDQEIVNTQQQNAQNQDLNEKGELNLDNITNKQDQNILDNQQQNPQKQPEKEKLNQDKQTDQDQEIVNAQQQNAQNQDLNEKGELNLDNNTNKIDQNILHNQQQNPQKQPEKEKLNQDKQTDQDQEIVNAQQQNAQNQDLNEKGELNLDNNTNKQDQNILDNQQQNPQKQPEKEKLNQDKQTDQDQEIVNAQQQNAQNQDLNEKGELNLDNNTNKQDQNILDNQQQNPQKQPEKEKLNQEKQTDQDQEIVNTQQQNAQNQDLNEKGELNLDNNTNKLDQKLNVDAQQQNAQNQDQPAQGELNQGKNTSKQDLKVVDTQQKPTEIEESKEFHTLQNQNISDTDTNQMNQDQLDQQPKLNNEQQFNQKQAEKQNTNVGETGKQNRPTKEEFKKILEKKLQEQNENKVPEIQDIAQPIHNSNHTQKNEEPCQKKPTKEEFRQQLEEILKNDQQIYS